MFIYILIMRVAITGAHSFTGRYVAEILINKGMEIVNLTNHPNRHWKIQSQSIRDVPLIFDREELIYNLRGCQALVQTYWVRFDNLHGLSREIVTNNSKMLIDCAREAGVKKVIYTSHTQTSLDSPFPYIQQKAKVEEYLKNSGMKWGIVKPCAIFGRTVEESILINNIAYLVRKFPLFPVTGNGNYPLQFVHVEDMAKIIVNEVLSGHSLQVDAVGPQKISFREIVEYCAKEMRTTCKIVPHIHPKILNVLTAPMNWYFDDILMDTNDLDLMTTGLTCSHAPPTGVKSLKEWISQNREQLGREWISSIKRYYK